MFLARSSSQVSRRGLASLARPTGIVFKGKNVLREGLSTKLPTTVLSIPRYTTPAIYSRLFSRRLYSTEAEDADASSQGREWVTAKDKITPGLYKALTSEPFSFTNMSPVQEAVVALLDRGIAAPSVDKSTASGSSKPKEAFSTLDLDEEPTTPGHEGGLVQPPKPDLLVKSKTGTGKTVAFLIPAIESRLKTLALQEDAFKAKNPSASKAQIEQHARTFAKHSTGTLILSPTRELATQIANEAIRLCTHIPGFQVQLLVGGVNKRMQLNQWTRGRRDIVVATPGRMNDLLTTESIVASSVAQAERLILDEADTLLDMGFKEDLRRIMSKLPSKEHRQTFMFSATLENDVKDIARAALNPRPIFVNTVLDTDSNTHAHVDQYVTVVEHTADYIPHVMRLIAQDQMQHPDGGKAIIFLPTTKYTELFAQLTAALKRDLPFSKQTLVYEMHSRKSQENRIKVARTFKESAEGTYKVLVTSDVSARGVDYPNVTRVIQLGIPSTPETYVHRVGRTGRAGREGRGDLVLLPWEKGYLTWCLKDVDLKTLTVADVEKDVLKLAEDIDASDASGVAPSVKKRLQQLNSTLRNSVLPIVPSHDVREVFQSLLGYYSARTSDLRLQKDSILEGCQDFAKSAFALNHVPEVSSSYLQRLGYSADRGGSINYRSFGGGSRTGGSNSRYGNGRTMGNAHRYDKERSGGYGFRRNEGGKGRQSLFE